MGCTIVIQTDWNSAICSTYCRCMCVISIRCISEETDFAEMPPFWRVHLSMWLDFQHTQIVTTNKQYSICGKTRGGSAMYSWLILTIFSGGQYKLGSWEASEGRERVNSPPPPDKSSTANKTYFVFMNCMNSLILHRIFVIIHFLSSSSIHPPLPPLHL